MASIENRSRIQVKVKNRDDRPLRAVAKDLGIHVGTAHRWRHRFLAGPQVAMPEPFT